jgi:hypothetical protein
MHCPRCNIYLYLSADTSCNAFQKVFQRSARCEGKRWVGHKNIQNTLIYVDLEATLFGRSSDGFTVRVDHDVGEAAALTEVGFEYVTGEYNDGGKIFRKHK